MAITSESQIINLSSVSNSLKNLDFAIESLNSAIKDLDTARVNCGVDNFKIKEENTFPNQIDMIKEYINGYISEINTLKSQISSSANTIYNAEKAEYDEYVKSQSESDNED